MIIDLEKEKVIGNVESVDTATVVVHVKDAQLLSSIQVNHLVVIRSSKVGQYLIGMVNKIVRKYSSVDTFLEDTTFEEVGSHDLVKIILVGTFIDKVGLKENVFKRTLQSVAEIDAECFTMSPETMSNFMGVISQSSSLMDNPLKIGRYVLNDTAHAFLDGNKFFQRHAVITGSTGSGKSYTVATVIEQIEKLKSSNAILFDIHGEYNTITGSGIKHYKIAGPGDGMAEDIMFLPYWLLSYDEMLSLLLDRSDSNAPNQAMLFSRYVVSKKSEYLKKVGKSEIESQFTIDSPIPYSIELLLDELHNKDIEMVPGANNKDKQGEFYGKLSRFIQRLENKISDKRLNFMFSKESGLMEYNYMTTLCEMLLAPASKDGGVKIINFSEVPSDVLPLIVSLIARVIFSVQQWVERDQIHPVALFCDEAHLYIPENARQGIETSSLSSFERIAKEGRKYGVALVVITQRPSEVNRTVLSQANNFIAMRLTNVDDQNVIKKLLPDNLGNYAEMLPILDVGEALIVGDASLLPSRIVVDKPEHEPNSATINFWDEWSKDCASDFIASAVESLRKQSK